MRPWIALVVVGCGRVGFDSVPAQGDGPGSDGALVAMDAPGAPGDALLVDAAPGPGAGCVNGVFNATNVLTNGGFETPLCQARQIDGWSVETSPQWVDNSGRPLASDDGACGVGASFGCSNQLLTFSGAGCLASFGQYTAPVGEWARVSQTYVAPQNIEGFALTFERKTGQFTYGWEYDVVVEVGGASVVVDSITGANQSGEVSSGELPTPARGTELTVSITLRRSGTGTGHGWLWIEDVLLDVCW
jgi:hypothetical protein